MLARARELGELRSLTSSSKDVSEEYYDVEARIRNKQKTESRLVTLLEKEAGNLEQVLKVEEKLDRVREEIERMQGRLRVLRDQTSLATVTLNIEQIRGCGGNADSAKKHLDEASSRIPNNIAEGNGKWSKTDRKKFVEVARGPALECASCLDILVAKRRINTDRVIEGKEKLRSIVNLLTKTITNLSEDS